nr:MAG TPA: TRAF PROTEIN, TRAO PROTEIN, TRAN ADHESION, BACTERIAL SECRETION.5A [Bacteriophage sp.]
MCVKMISLITGALLCFSGCATDGPKAPTIITEYKEVPVPVRCNVEMPVKPYYDKKKPQTAKALAEYYLLCEDFLKQCLGIKDKN